MECINHFEGQRKLYLFRLFYLERVVQGQIQHSEISAASDCSMHAQSKLLHIFQKVRRECKPPTRPDGYQIHLYFQTYIHHVLLMQKKLMKPIPVHRFA